jgi:hypothetical protein
MSQEQEEDSALELFIQRQIEQDQDEDFKMDYPLKKERECPSHEYEFLELLPSHEPDMIEQLFVCVICGNTRVLHTRVGVRD